MAALSELILLVFEERDSISHTELVSHLAKSGTFTQEEILEEINNLMRYHVLAGLVVKEEVVYSRLSDEQSKTEQSLKNEEMLVLQFVREAGNIGIWNQDLKTKTHIPTARVNNILKELEQKKLVKKIKSVQHKNRLMWMLSELEPSAETAGNFLFQGQEEFNSSLLHNLMNYSKAFLQRQSATLRPLTAYLRQQTNQQLSEENVQNVLDMMESLNQIERLEGGLYLAVTWTVPEPPPLPCLLCPLAKECQKDALISPKTCEYLTSWLNPSHPS